MIRVMAVLLAMVVLIMVAVVALLAVWYILGGVLLAIIIGAVQTI